MKISKAEYGKATANPVADQKILPEERPRKSAERASVEKAQLSPLEQGIMTAEEALKLIPDVREDIVSGIKEAVEKGEYKISGGEVADMMMRRRLADKVR